MAEFNFFTSEELEELVSSLENGETKLEEALSLYKKGIGIIEVLGKRLNDARKQIETVGETDSGDLDNE